MKLESLEELKIFAQVVESGSLTAAARALSLPATTVGRRLASLEDRLGTKLLHRTTRTQSLSEPGRTLLARCRTILVEVEAAEAALVAEQEGLNGVVRIGVPSVLSRDLLDMLAPLMDQHPGLRLRVSIHDRLVSPVAAGLDVVVMGGRLADSTLIARKLVDVTTVLVASEAYLQRRGIPGSVDDLTGHQTLQFASDPPHTTWVLTDADGQQHVVPVNSRFEANDGRALIDAIDAGLGIGMTSPRVLQGKPRLRRVLPGLVGGTFPVHAIYPASRQRSARLRAVVDTLQAGLRSSPGT